MKANIKEKKNFILRKLQLVYWNSQKYLSISKKWEVMYVSRIGSSNKSSV